MQGAEWLLDGDRICLESASGQRVYPDARQVFRAVFAGVSDIEGMRPDRHPSEAFPGISFSRYPAEPAVRIHGSAPGQIVASLGVRTEAGFRLLPDGDDQVLAAGRWYPVNREAMAGAGAWLAQFGVREGEPVTLGQMVSLRSAGNAPVSVIDDTAIAPAEVAARAGQALETIPGLQADLYPYQRDGVAFLRLVAQEGIGCILGDEMGLGKTLQVIALLQSEKNAGRGHSLVVAPATLLENWRREIRQFAPQMQVHVHAGAARAGIAGHLEGNDVVVTSFDTALRDELLLSGVSWNVLVVDEAQAIKNPDAQRTHAVKRIPRRVSLAVTGTPVENRLDDLWSVADFALPGMLGNLSEFRSRFTDDVNDAARLGPVVAPILLRRQVADVARDLPPKIEIPQPIPMSRGMAEAYEALRLQTLEEYGAAAGMVATIRLRILCTHPALCMSWHPDPAHEMPKYQRLLEIFGEIAGAGEKALVFTTYLGMADLLMQDIPRRWPDGFFRYIDGRVAVQARQATVDDFFAHAGFGALFLNPKAAGTGLNITAASHVIHYNPEWNPALTQQASARAYRRKQQRPVTIHHLFFSDSIEEVMVERAGFKRELAEGAVTGHEGDLDPAVLMRALQVSPLSTFEGVEQ